MTDFNILRKRYSEVLCGRGHSGKRTADCILRSDERTEQRLAQLDTRIEKAIKRAGNCKCNAEGNT